MQVLAKLCKQDVLHACFFSILQVPGGLPPSEHSVRPQGSSIITGTICTCPFPVFVPTSNCSSFALLSSGVGVTVVWLCSGATGTLLRPSRTRTLAAAGAGPESGQTSQDWCFAYYLASSLDIQALTENWKALLPLTPVRAALREGLA